MRQDHQLGSIGEARRGAEFRRGPDIANDAIGIVCHQRFEHFANKQTRIRRQLSLALAREHHPMSNCPKKATSSYQAPFPHDACYVYPIAAAGVRADGVMSKISVLCHTQKVVPLSYPESRTTVALLPIGADTRPASQPRVGGGWLPYDSGLTRGRYPGVAGVRGLDYDLSAMAPACRHLSGSPSARATGRGDRPRPGQESNQVSTARFGRRGRASVRTGGPLDNLRRRIVAELLQRFAVDLAGLRRPLFCW